MSDKGWYSGEYLADRIFFTIIFIFLLILLCVNCMRSDEFKRLMECMKACYYYCFYKQAKVVPLTVAVETHDPIIYIARQVPTGEVKVLWA